MIQKKEIIASNLNYNLIDDQMDTMNKQRENMNVKVIDESIKENDHSHQNIENTTSQGAKITLFLNTTNDLTVTGVSELPNPASLHGSISSIKETKAQQLDSFLTNNFVDALDS